MAGTDNYKTVVVASDSFKGSLRSTEVAASVASGILSVCPSCRVIGVPIADGGEGTVEAVVTAAGGSYIEKEVSDPLMRKVRARYGMINETTTVIEIASASGLTLLTPSERNPMLTTTYGTGELILDALGRGCRKIILGLGGSATTDGATGLLSALGYRFLDSRGYPLFGCGESLGKIVRIDAENLTRLLRGVEIILASDVRSPLCGPLGAAAMFAPQKGADASAVKILDKGLANFAKAVFVYNGMDITDMEGAGAAGGAGGGLASLLGARLRSGIDVVLETMGFDRIIRGSDLVITGEGRIDRQTVMGKAPAGVLRAAQREGIPVAAIGGTVESCTELELSGFAAMVSATPFGMPLSEAMRGDVAAANVRRAASEIARKFLL